MQIESCSLEEVLQTLESEPLSDTLPRLDRFAQSRGFAELSQWAIAELQGYSSQYPDYRVVTLSYFDSSGQPIAGLSEQYGSWPLLNGVTQLELYLKNGMTLKLPPAAIDFLSQVTSRPVFGGHVSATQLKSLLTSIRTEATEKLKQFLND